MRLSPTPIWELLRWVALIIPVVTVLSKPKGLPIAIAHSPICTPSESANCTVGKDSASILTTAMSVILSSPETCHFFVSPETCNMKSVT